MTDLILYPTDDGRSQIKPAGARAHRQADTVGNGGTLRCHEAEHLAAPEMNALNLCTSTEGGRSQIRLRAQEQTVWLTQLEMAELFVATKQKISLHLKKVFEEGELDPVATVKESLTVQVEPGRAPTAEKSSVVQDCQQRKS